MRNIDHITLHNTETTRNAHQALLSHVLWQCLQLGKEESAKQEEEAFAAETSALVWFAGVTLKTHIVRFKLHEVNPNLLTMVAMSAGWQGR